MLLLSLAIQLVFGNLVKGRIEERIIDVNPALLVLFIVALGQLGFLWLFLAAPVAGAARDLFRYFLRQAERGAQAGRRAAWRGPAGSHSQPSARLSAARRVPQVAPAQQPICQASSKS